MHTSGLYHVDRHLPALLGGPGGGPDGGEPATGALGAYI